IRKRHQRRVLVEAAELGLLRRRTWWPRAATAASCARAARGWTSAAADATPACATHAAATAASASTATRASAVRIARAAARRRGVVAEAAGLNRVHDDARVVGVGGEAAVVVAPRQVPALLGEKDQVLLAVEPTEILDARVQTSRILHGLAIVGGEITEARDEIGPGHAVHLIGDVA